MSFVVNRLAGKPKKRWNESVIECVIEHNVNCLKRIESCLTGLNDARFERGHSGKLNKENESHNNKISVSVYSTNVDFFGCK